MLEGFHYQNAYVTPDIERAIAIVTFPEQKAPQLKTTLQQITARYGSLTLDFLAKCPRLDIFSI